MKMFVIVTTLLMFARPLWPVVEYVVNYDYIVNSLCENRDRPELECNGSCYLSKQLAKQAADSEKNPFEKGGKNPVFQPLFVPVHETLPTLAGLATVRQPLLKGQNEKATSHFYGYVQPKPPQA